MYNQSYPVGDDLEVATVILLDERHVARGEDLVRLLDEGLLQPLQPAELRRITRCL